MVISTYQVNNVLRVYGDQLRQGKLVNRTKGGLSRKPDRISISVEAKRKMILDKIASDIVEKITQYGPQENVEKEVSQNLENEFGVSWDITREGSTQLIFKVIDENGETLNSLSIEDANFSGDKLKEIPKGKSDAGPF